MRILLTLDYELFLGERTGSVERCLVEPMRRLTEAVEPTGARFTLFVDATYLFRLFELKADYAALDAEYQQIVSHLRMLRAAGHDLQLHIHPHWHYSTFEDGKWRLDHTRYKLCDIPFEEALWIFASAKEHLDAVLGYATHAFRAGGFSTQPTQRLTTLFAQNGIRVDSSVCPGQRYQSPQQTYDYRTALPGRAYRFGADINVPDPDGAFTEVPISMHAVSPLFYWKYVATRLLKVPGMRPWGDGQSVKATNESIRERLTRRTVSMATIDGFKIGALESAYQAARRRGDALFCVIGHPKLANPYSVRKLSRFCERRKRAGDTFITISEI